MARGGSYVVGMTRRYALRDDQWDRIKDLLPGRPGQVGRNAKDNRLFVEAVLYRYRAGIAWRDLPERFGDFRVVHLRHSRWSKSGVWRHVFEALAVEADNEYAMIDSTSTVRGPKNGSRRKLPSYRAQPGWPEHQDPRHGRCAGQSDGCVPDAAVSP